MPLPKSKSSVIHDILTRVGTRKTKEERIQVLKENNCLALRDILKGGFDDSIQFILPEGSPPYEAAPEQNPPSSLHKLSKNFKYFAVGGPGEKLPSYRVEQMFIRVLEAIHPKDAELVIAMKDKTIAGKYRGLSKKLVQEAFPNLISK